MSLIAYVVAGLLIGTVASLAVTYLRHGRIWLPSLPRRKPRTKEQALDRIREHYRALGIPVDHMSDQELEASILAFGKAMAKVGVSAKQMAESFARTFEAMGRAVNMSAADIAKLGAQVRDLDTSVEPH